VLSGSRPRSIQRAARYGAAAVILCLPLPSLLGLANLSYLPVSLVAVGLAVGLSRLEDGDHRRLFLELFAIAFSLRFVALVAVTWVASEVGGPFLGPDSTNYLRGGYYLAEHALHAPSHPAFLFGTFDSAPFYLFGAVVYLLGADLFGLQLFSCGLTALVGPIVHAWSRSLVPRHALVVGLVVSVFPSLIVLSVLDLLKDGPIVAGLAIAAWSLTRLIQAPPRWTHLVSAGLAGLALLFLQTSRFYVAAYLDAAMLVAAALVLLRFRRSTLNAVATTLVLLPVVGASLTASALGWPPLHRQVRDSVSLVLQLPVMRDYADGLIAGAGGSGERPSRSRLRALGEWLGIVRPEAIRPPLERPEGMLVSMEAPTGPVSGVVLGRGWAVQCGGDIERHQLIVNGSAWRDTRFSTHLPRPEIARDLPSGCVPADDRIGFEFDFDASRLGSFGRHVVQIDVTNDQGAVGRTEPVVVRVDTSNVPLPGMTRRGALPAAAASRSTRLQPESGASAAAAAPSAAATREPVSSLVTVAADTFRRLYGPFVWIAPQRWTAHELLTNDYPLYPGMLIWYALLPLMAVGFLRTGWDLLAGRRQPAPLATLWFFVAFYGLQYLAINLSYRQREVLFPFLLVLATAGLPVTETKAWRYGYIAYWGLLVVIATGHLVVRARM